MLREVKTGGRQGREAWRAKAPPLIVPVTTANEARVWAEARGRAGGRRRLRAATGGAAGVSTSQAHIQRIGFAWPP